jgi:cell division inhibitor SulA
MSGVSGKVSGRNHEETFWSRFFGEKRVHLSDSLLIPQNELNTSKLARASIPEFAGKREEDPVRFLLQAEAILKETGIHMARWVTVLTPQLKAQAGT